MMESAKKTIFEMVTAWFRGKASAEEKQMVTFALSLMLAIIAVFGICIYFR